MIINRYYIEVFKMEDSKKLKEWIFQINRKKNI